MVVGGGEVSQVESYMSGVALVGGVVWMNVWWCGYESCGVDGAETIDVVASIM